jgi:uncharacterized protein YxeA
MKKKLFIIIIIIIVAAAIIGAGFLYFNLSREKIDLNQIILFYGQTCPHCKIVDDYIKNNNIEQKIKFIKLEVFNNQQNAKILSERAVSCGISSKQVGVPFLWTGSACVIGDVNVIDFLKEKLK